MQLRWRRGTHATHCPEQAELERQVQSRLGRNPFAADALRTIEASIDVADGLWHVELSVRDADGPVQGRRVFDVRAESCTQVVDAVGLAVALAIDPNASYAIDPAAPGLSASGLPANPSTRNDMGSLVASTCGREAQQAYPYAQIFASMETPLASDNPAHVELTLRGIAAAGLLPKVAPGFAVAGSVGYQNSHAVFGISYFPETSLNRQFAFGLTTFDLDYCHDIVRSFRLAAGLCAGVHAGALHSVVVTQLVPLRPGDRFYAAASLGPRLGWRAWASFFIEGGVSAWVPLVRPEFLTTGTGSDLTVFKSQPVSGVGYLGAGWMTN